MVKKNDVIDTRIYALVTQKDNSLKRILLDDLKKMIKSDLKKWSNTKDGKNYKKFYHKYN